MTNFVGIYADGRIDIFGLSFRIEAAGVMTLRLLCVYEGGNLHDHSLEADHHAENHPCKGHIQHGQGHP